MVVSDTTDQYNASKNVTNVCGSTLNMTSAEIITYAMASPKTTVNESFSLLKTFPINKIFLEYRIVLKIRNTLNVLINLTILNNLNPLFTIDKDGKIEIKSINAIPVNG